jgi:hypothetical protein
VSFTVLLYIAFIIVFIILRLRKQRKNTGRKPWTPPSAAAGRASVVGGQKETFPAEKSRESPSGGSRPAAAQTRNTDPFSEFLRKISGQDFSPTASAATEEAAIEEDDDGAVENSWRAFRPEAEVKVPEAPPRAAPVSPVVPSRVIIKPESRVSPPSAEIAPVAQEAEDGKTIPRPVTAISGGFPSRLPRLGPLQQAIVMAEVLGKPKALREEEFPF